MAGCRIGGVATRRTMRLIPLIPASVMRQLDGIGVRNAVRSTWFGNGWTGWDIGFAMFLFRFPQRVPRGWRDNADGSLPDISETDEYGRALELPTNVYALGLDAFFTGRTGLNQFDQTVPEWRDRGGVQIRQEYQEWLRQSGG